MRRSTLPAGHFEDTCAAVLRWDRATLARKSSAPASPSRPPSADRNSLHCHLDYGSRANRFDLIRPFLHVVAGDGPAVLPLERPNIQHARAASVKVRFVVEGKLLHALAEIEQAKVARTDHAARLSQQTACPRPGTCPRPCCRQTAPPRFFERPTRMLYPESAPRQQLPCVTRR